MQIFFFKFSNIKSIDTRNIKNLHCISKVSFEPPIQDMYVSIRNTNSSHKTILITYTSRSTLVGQGWTNQKWYMHAHAHAFIFPRHTFFFSTISHANLHFPSCLVILSAWYSFFTNKNDRLLSTLLVETRVVAFLSILTTTYMLPPIPPPLRKEAGEEEGRRAYFFPCFLINCEYSWWAEIQDDATPRKDSGFFFFLYPASCLQRRYN